VQLLKRLNDELSAQRVLLLVLKVSVKDEANAASVDDMVAQVLSNPSQIRHDHLQDLVLVNRVAQLFALRRVLGSAMGGLRHSFVDPLNGWGHDVQ